MKLELTINLIPKMTLDAFPEHGVPPTQWKAATGPNYLVYDAHGSAPSGFAIRVGRRASVYIVEKLVNGKKMKIHVGLARGRKGNEQIIDLETARKRAAQLITVAMRHGVNPKKIDDPTEASELTMSQIWNQYVTDLKSRSQPVKPNSLLSLKKARDKFEDWEHRKIRMIAGQEILDRFDLHAVTNAHRTSAEAMGRWATAAVDHAIEKEIRSAHSVRRVPSLTYNPFTILNTEGKYRSRDQLERDYESKGVRNPLPFSESVGPFVEAAWKYRARNPIAADFILLDLLWGLRGDECRSTKWRDRISELEAKTTRWIDMKAKVVCINDAQNRGDHEFPIGPWAYELLKLRRESQPEGEQWVFPAKSSQSMKGHYSVPTIAIQTVREMAGIKTIRGLDLRRTFGAACETLGLSDRHIKRMLSHGAVSDGKPGPYKSPEWNDYAERMHKVEQVILRAAPSVYNALRPRGAKRMAE